MSLRVAGRTAKGKIPYKLLYVGMDLLKKKILLWQRKDGHEDATQQIYPSSSHPSGTQIVGKMLCEMRKYYQ